MTGTRIALVFAMAACGGSGREAGESGGGSADSVTVTGQDDGVTNGTVYYVSPGGNDEANGTGESSPFRTLARGLEAVRPGGTVVLLPGAYSESVIVASRGNTAAPITIRGTPGAALDGSQAMAIGLFLDSCTNFVVEDLEVRNYTDFGLGSTGSTALVFRRLVVRDNGHSVQLVDWELEGYGLHLETTSQVRVEECELFGNGPHPPVPGRLMGTAINTWGCTSLVVRANRCHDNQGGGILIEDGADVLVEGNEVYGNNLDATAEGWWDGALWVDGGRDVVVSNNSFHDNIGPGIQISDEDLQHPTGYVLQNNVSTGNHFGIYVWNFGGTPAPSVLQLSGNQFAGNTVQDVWIQP